MFNCVILNSLFDREMKAYYVTQVLKQCINIQMVRSNYILEFRHTHSHLLHVYLGTWAKIETVIENQVC